MHFLCVFFTCETRELREEGKKWQQREKKKDCATDEEDD